MSECVVSPLGSGHTAVRQALALLLRSLYCPRESWIWKGCFEDGVIKPTEMN